MSTDYAPKKLKPAWWISWYSGRDGGEFELHSPWWISGYDMNDRTIYVAAVRAEDESEAWQIVRNAYDEPRSEDDLEERFCDDLSGEEPFTDRWPRAEWMEWNEFGETCRCYDCKSRTGGTT